MLLEWVVSWRASFLILPSVSQHLEVICHHMRTQNLFHLHRVKAEGMVGGHRTTTVQAEGNEKPTDEV